MKKIATAILILILAYNAKAADGPYPFKGSATLKINALGGNIQESANGLAFQYYIKNAIGLQLNADFLRVGNGFANAEFTEIKGNGIRIMPEFRYYTLRSDRSHYVSFYWSAALMLKYNYVQIGDWVSAWDDHTGQFYRTYQRSVNHVFALGFMPQAGIEAYLDKERRFLLDGTLGIGFAQNWISGTYDDASGWDFFDEFTSNNQREGVFPYLNIKLALGYRIFR